LPSTTRADLDPDEEHIVVHFPLEWIRDPKSHYLREYPVDIPWDEPELVKAIVGHVMANFRNATSSVTREANSPSFSASHR
jgi:hypothetical protein